MKVEDGEFSHYGFGRGILTGDSPHNYSVVRMEPDSVNIDYGVSHMILSDDNQYVYAFMLRGEKFKDVLVARALGKRFHVPFT